MSGNFGVVGILDGWKKGNMLGNQMVNIILNSYTTIENGHIAVTAQLATAEEVDYAVDQLIKDLEFVRKKAKDKIAKTNNNVKASCKSQD